MNLLVWGGEQYWAFPLTKGSLVLDGWKQYKTTKYRLDTIALLYKLLRGCNVQLWSKLECLSLAGSNNLVKYLRVTLWDELQQEESIL
jgi:hypothetical protein